MRFRSTVELGGRTATGLPVPAEVVEALGAGRRPAVVVTVAGHSYPSTVSVRDGRFLVPLSAEHRAAAGVAAGDEVEVDVVLDTGPREVEVPADLAAALAPHPDAVAHLAGLAPGLRKEWVRWVTEAKREETRRARVAQAVADLRAGKKRH